MSLHAPKSTFTAGLVTALPIALGYFPIAFSFGVAATRAGLTGLEAFGLSLIIYAGAAQFLALALITGGAPVLVSAFTLVAMNIRHVLYGPALIKRVGPDARTKHAWAWAFGLTDEVFGAALGALARGKVVFSEAFMFGLGLAAYGSWLSGTALGAFAGGAALQNYPVIDAALGFMLPALFLALLLSILSKLQLPVIAVAMAATVAVTLAWSGTAGILAGMVAGAVSGLLVRRNDAA
ncbi:AzlC family ABC transporter permease [Cypionkella sp.]|jgi:4-azaleucine resistance transporter AzlC|uniref:AzlC family ABC transporter permease n=1 Tax=Cypionkella sp. TaxID=2811411 RepID=UPI00271A84B1|nr:AzlC family ABC transporter permease [Cypionkella sp.]MDO8985781.1 AzlC family ABC transporter permease [Cypionkella sp.]MDP2051361.1 AzlC family ABC transporter permease [Cypionkella sp.]